MNRWLSTMVLSVFLLIVLLAACSPRWDVPASAPDLDTAEQPGASTDDATMAFVSNAGQMDPAVLFHTLGSVGTLFFAHHEVVLPLPSSKPIADLFGGWGGSGESDLAVVPSVLHLRFDGADPAARVVGAEQLTGRVNYFIGNDPANWRTHVPTYGSIICEQLYAGIDLYYTGSEGILKGAFVVAPGASPGDILWRYDGASRVELSEGELLIHVDDAGDAAPLVEREPIAWQVMAGQRRAVSVRYVVHGDDSIGFVLGKYDTAYPLLIDPTLDYGTYLGGRDKEISAGVAVDANNQVYVTGITESSDFPSSDSGCIAGDFDIFVTKLDPSQNGADQLIYTTYIGGQALDFSAGIGVDSSGNVYVAGGTDSNDFPTTANAFQPDFNAGGRDGIVVQLDAAGAVHYASYLGGMGYDEFAQLAVGDNGLLYAVGLSSSSDFPTTGNAYQGGIGGPWLVDAVVAVVDPSESGAASLVYATYYGGSDGDEGYAIDVSSDGNIYFAGHTRSGDLPLKNPIQALNNGGEGFGDAYVVRLDPSLSGSDQLLFATYLGGASDDASGGVAVDASGNIYWVGATASADFPTTDASPPYGGGEWDAFVVKLDPVTPNLVHSRFLGGSGSDGIRSVVLDAYGNAYVAGATGSEDFPTVNPIQDTFKGGMDPDWSWLGPGDAFVAAFDTAGTMVFSTYLGGTLPDVALGIALDGEGNVVVAGGTKSYNLVTANPFQGAKAGWYDVFITSMGGVAPPTPTLTITPTPTSTPTDTPTPTVTNTPTTTHTPTVTPTDTPTPTPTSTATATPTLSPTPTATVMVNVYLPLVLKSW